MRSSSITFLFHLVLSLSVGSTRSEVEEEEIDDDLIVSCETTKGTFKIELMPTWAPIGVARFVDLVNDDFFSDAYIFRAVPNFLVQFGIGGTPEKHTEWAQVGPIPDDPRAPDLGEGANGENGTFPRGGVAFAGNSENSRTTQIFIPFQDDLVGSNPWETQIGTVIEGMDVIENFFNGYGDIQDFNPNGIIPYKLEDEGAKYVEMSFPRLDKILSCEVESMSHEFEEMPKYVAAKFVNEMDHPVHLYYADQEEEQFIYQGQLDPGSEAHLDCYTGHTFVIKDSEDGSGPVLASYEIEFGVLNYLYGNYEDEEDDEEEGGEEEEDDENDEDDEDEDEDEEDDEDEDEEDDEDDEDEDDEDDEDEEEQDL